MTKPTSTDRRADLTTAVLEEIASHQPLQAMRYMRKLHGGALSLVHLQVLTTLEADGPVPMRRLAELLDVSQASATGIVDRMEQRALVERVRDEEDRRVVRVALTPHGADTIRAMSADRREHIRSILAELTDDELAAFLTGLRAMRRARERIHDRLREDHEVTNPGVRFHDDVLPAPSPKPEGGA